MGRCRFVQPETETLKLSEGYYVVVKRRLTIGERRDAMQLAAGSYDVEGKFTPNMAMAGIAQIHAFLVEWNLTGPDDKLVAIDSDAKKLAALRQLDRETFNEIDTAIAAHIAAIEKADAERKNGQSGEPGSGPTLPSAA